MKTFVTDDGRHFLIPGNVQRAVATVSRCECHEKMGSDFYFLPLGSCLRKDKTCNEVKQ